MLYMKRGILLWLWGILGLTFVMVFVGGVTRLTGSGLSMVEWRPVFGFLPPMNAAEWERVFSLYMETPQYLKIHSGMSLNAFKGIFFWEYLHRVLGRVVGLVALIPYLWFWIRGDLDLKWKCRGALVVGLVVLQGVVGWFMVMSGLVDVPAVSHFRLALHLGMAFGLLGIIWVWILGGVVSEPDRGGLAKYRRYWGGVLGVLILQIVYGAFVAGMKAGYLSREFPKFMGEWVPDIVGVFSPFWTNFFMNPFMVLFLHRWIGVLVAVLVVVGYFWMRRERLSRFQRVSLNLVLMLVVFQVVLGILTLALGMPIGVAVLHQFVAGILLLGVVGLFVLM